MAKGQEYILAHGDEITIGSGVPKDMSQFIVTFPGKSVNSPPTDGVHAFYDMRSEVLGQGAFAVVKKAIERATGDWYAVKVIDKKKVMTGVAVDREIDILKKLKHEFIVGLKDFYEDGNNYYLVMDLVTGGDLMDFVTQNGRIPEDAAREITRQVLTAVEYVHSRGISHRDIKPDNILIAQDEPVVVKVSDFGLAKISKSGSQLRTFCGTLAYLAPEIMAKKHAESNGPIMYSNKVDIWSVGCMLYVILTSYLPFNNRTQQELYKSVMSGRFAEEPLVESEVSKDCIDFLRAVLTVDPAKRPSAAESLKHKWFGDITYDTESYGRESTSQTADTTEATALNNGNAASAPSIVQKAGVASAASKSLRLPSIKPQRSEIQRDPSVVRGIKNPEDFVSFKAKSVVRPNTIPEEEHSHDKDVDIPDINSVPDLIASKSSATSSGRDIIMETPEESQKNTSKGEGSSSSDTNMKDAPRDVNEELDGQKILKNKPEHSPITQKINTPSKTPNGTKVKFDQSENAYDSDKDNEEITKAAGEQFRQQINDVNSSVLHASLHNDLSPLKVQPFISVVRDTGHDDATDLPIGSWLILNTLESSIPHREICLTQPCVTFGRYSEDNLDVVLNDNRISRIHAAIWLEPVEDGSERYKVWFGDWSRNGCYVNGKTVSRGKKTRLQDGDTIYFLKELTKTEFLGFKVNMINPSDVVTREEEGPVVDNFEADAQTFKGWKSQVTTTNAVKNGKGLVTPNSNSPQSNKRVFSQSESNGNGTPGSDRPSKKISVRANR